MSGQTEGLTPEPQDGGVVGGLPALGDDRKVEAIGDDGSNLSTTGLDTRRTAVPASRRAQPDTTAPADGDPQGYAKEVEDLLAVIKLGLMDGRNPKPLDTWESWYEECKKRTFLFYLAVRRAVAAEPKEGAPPTLEDIDAALARRIWPAQASGRITAWNEAIQQARSDIAALYARRSVAADAPPTREPGRKDVDDETWADIQRLGSFAAVLAERAAVPRPEPDHE